MARYIDAVQCADIISEKLNIPLGDLVDVFAEIPTADVVEAKHGEWREVSEKYPRYVCTACNHLFNNKSYNYCPCCGAKMDGRRDT